MKKFLISITSVIMLFSVTSCGNKKAFEKSKNAYENVNAAYEIVENYGDDIYSAWRVGIYESDELDKDGLSHLAKEVNLTKEDLSAGLAYLAVGDNWDEASEEEQKEIIELGDEAFEYLKKNTDNVFSLTVQAVSAAYKVTGKSQTVKDYIGIAKEQMKEMSENYSDYEHYPSLKEFFTTTSAYFDFCENPTGSFEQVKTTVDDYRNKARDCKSDLDYIFE